MIYSLDVTTPADTAKVDAKHSVLTITGGLVYRVEIQFPRMCAGLLYCQIFDGGHQVWPSSLGEWFRGDGNTIQFQDTYLKLAAPYQFDVFTYNLDDTYGHAVLIRIGLVSREIFMARFLPSYSWKYFKKMLEEMAKAEEERARAAASQPLGWIE